MIRQRYLKRNPAIYPVEPAALPAAVGGFAIIPVYDENEYIFHTLQSVKQALQRSPRPAAVVLVINEPARATENSRRNNAELLQSLRKNDGKYDGGLAVGSELFFIDLTDKEIPDKFRNVGNARKCGFDAVISASDGKVTDQNTLFFSLDADTLVDENYFVNAFCWQQAHPEYAGAVFHFAHRSNGDGPAAEMAMMRYEYYLRDYAWKVRSCGSYFGFWTIGSAFMCTMRDYMRCGGMRRNAAGEDFYFLQALRKTGMIGTVPDCQVYPSGRISGRVPFGTGPAIASQLAGEKRMLYNERIFELLKEFFAAVSSAENPAEIEMINLAPDELKKYLQILDFANVWSRIVRNTPRRKPALIHALQTYCDGFFILKFAHYLEEKYPEKFARRSLPGDECITAELEQLRRRDREKY